MSSLIFLTKVTIAKEEPVKHPSFLPPFFNVIERRSAVKIKHFLKFRKLFSGMVRWLLSVAVQLHGVVLRLKCLGFKNTSYRLHIKYFFCYFSFPSFFFIDRNLMVIGMALQQWKMPSWIHSRLAIWHLCRYMTPAIVGHSDSACE